MKLLLLLEHDFVRDSSGNVWSQRVVDYAYLKRYLNVFDEVSVCARILDVDVKPENYKMLVSGKNVEFFPLPYLITSKELILNALKIRTLFKKYISKVDASIVRGPSILSLMLYDICINKLPFSVEFVMGADKIIVKKSIVTKFINNFLNRRAKKMCLAANGVSYVTKYNLQETYPSFSIKNGTDSIHFDEYYSSIDIYDDDYSKKISNFFKNPSVFKLIHIGYMDDNRKGQLQVIDIVNKLIKNGFKVEMTFIGDGKNKEFLIQRTKDLNISEYFYFAGNITDKNIKFKNLQDSHLFVFPSSSEGLPRVLIEAMATSTPCVSTPTDGIPELLEADYLIDRDDIDGYVNIISKMLNDMDLMIKLSNDNYFKAQEYNYNVLSKKRNEFYKKLRDLVDKID